LVFAEIIISCHSTAGTLGWLYLILRASPKAPKIELRDHTWDKSRLFTKWRAEWNNFISRKGASTTATA
jgi:hypothetical protein